MKKIKTTTTIHNPNIYSKTFLIRVSKGGIHYGLDGVMSYYDGIDKKTLKIHVAKDGEFVFTNDDPFTVYEWKNIENEIWNGESN